MILVASIVLQFTAAVLAVRLTYVTGRRWAWSLVAVAVALMGVRRCITFVRWVATEDGVAPHLQAELVALTISGLMCLGLALVGPAFRSMKDRADRLEVSLERERRARSQLDSAMTTLARSNRELEEYAWITSHDLQEPLRMVASYMQLLERRYKAELNEEAREFIGYAVEGTVRMKKLINDLLAYSRLAANPRDFGRVSLDQVLREAQENLGVAIRETGARIASGPLPEVVGDAAHLCRLLQNLLENAIKYRSEAVPEIHVDATVKDESTWLISVRDNGIGMDPSHKDRVFRIFQRLHKREEHEGTGIGLATCKKIIELHGGEIWLDSEPGHGATTYFTLPGVSEESLVEAAT